MKRSTGFTRKFMGLATMANHDFCPWANRYVYWLKQPVGWFLIATVASLLVGIFLSPLGWAVAAGLAGILVLGLGFPWIAVRMVHCQITPVASEIHERQSSFLELKVSNRLPIPIFGLLVEGYLTSYFSDVGEDSSGAARESAPDIGLAVVPAWSMATYRLAIRPEYRGRYPHQAPVIACAFPFGIWKSRCQLGATKAITVWPLLFRSCSEVEVTGSKIAEFGNGNRASSQGDFIGVREFRRGDSLRSIHWVQTARQNSLIVCERGGPQKQAIDLHLTTERGLGSAFEARENLAWRVRIMASLIDLAVSRHVPFRLYVDHQMRLVSQGNTGLRQALKILTDIPLDGFQGSASPENENANRAAVAGASTRILVSGHDQNACELPSHLVRLQVKQSLGNLRGSVRMQSNFVDLDQDIGWQVNQLLMEASRESRIA